VNIDKQDGLKRALLNDFATRCFRDTADQDYIVARLSYRAGLFPQFHWQALQALEKYLKAILLYNRIKAKRIKHDLGKALNKCKELPFELSYSEVTKEFIDHVDTFGRYRYLESSYFINGPKLVQLDKAVWDIRRYCRVLNYEVTLPSGKVVNMLEHELEEIRQSENRPAQEFRIMSGLLEQIVDNKKHLARTALIWQNGFFGKKNRRFVKAHRHFHATNAPLSLHPEVLDEAIKYVLIPQDVVDAYRLEKSGE